MHAGWTLGETILVIGSLSVATPYAMLLAFVTWQRRNAARALRAAPRQPAAAPRICADDICGRQAGAPRTAQREPAEAAGTTA